MQISSKKTSPVYLYPEKNKSNRNPENKVQHWFNVSRGEFYEGTTGPFNGTYHKKIKEALLTEDQYRDSKDWPYMSIDEHYLKDNASSVIHTHQFKPINPKNDDTTPFRTKLTTDYRHVAIGDTPKTKMVIETDPKRNNEYSVVCEIPDITLKKFPKLPDNDEYALPYAKEYEIKNELHQISNPEKRRAKEVELLSNLPLYGKPKDFVKKSQEIQDKIIAATHEFPEYQASLLNAKFTEQRRAIPASSPYWKNHLKTIKSTSVNRWHQLKTRLSKLKVLGNFINKYNLDMKLLESNKNS